MSIQCNAPIKTAVTLYLLLILNPTASSSHGEKIELNQQKVSSKVIDKPGDGVADDVPCGFNFTARVLWSSPVGGPGSPFVAAPVLAPLLPVSSSSSFSASFSPSGGNYLVVSAAFHGEIGVLSASSGLPLPGSRFPVHLPSATVYASPLLHDVDSDGSLDVVVVTGEGVVHSFDLLDGAQLVDGFVIEPLKRVEKKWLEETTAAADAAKRTVFPDLALRSPRDVGETKEVGGGIGETTTLGARVLASPVIVDLNGDGRVEEMIVPVTYSNEEFLLTSLTVLNATSGFSLLKRVPLELSRSMSEFPAYLLHAPTVVDLDSRSGDVEILVASTSGKVFAFDAKFDSLRAGFPLEVDALVAPVVTHDLDGNGRLEIVLADRSGVVHCFDTKGNVKWQTSLANENGTLPSSSSSSSSNLFSIVGVPRVFDFDSAFDSDGDEIGVTTTDGVLYVISGVTGAVVARHALPVAAGSPLAAGLLVTRVVTKPDEGPPDLISLSLDGHLHILTSRIASTERTDTKDNGKRVSTTLERTRVTCHERVELGEASMTSLLSADLDGAVPGHEILVSTHDGLLMALTIAPTSADGRQQRQRRESGSSEVGNSDHVYPNHNVNDPAYFGGGAERRGFFAMGGESAIPAWESEVPGGGTRFGFAEPAPAIVIKDWTKSRQHVTGETFTVAFDVGEAATEGKDELMRVKVSLGSLLLAETSITRSGFHVLRVRTPDEPMRGHLIVRMTNRHGQVFADSYTVSLNEALVHDLQWVLLAPFVATVVTYLVVHGYPEGETLPTTVFKGR